MSRFARVTCIVLVGLGMFSVAVAQSADQPRFTVDYCVKVKEGKGADYAALIRDVSAKMAQVRIDEGSLASYAVGRAVIPAGSSARCDYHILYGFVGWPPEALTPEQTEAVMKKAGLSMTREQMIAMRNEASTLVSADMWQGQTRVGQVTKDSYVRLNYYKIRPGMTADWIRMESEGWRKLVEKASEEHQGIAWGASTLAMPGGTSREYNAITYDSFPTWEAFGRGLPTRELWMKVHPQQDFSAFLERVDSLIDRPRIDVIKMVEVLRGN